MRLQISVLAAGLRLPTETASTRARAAPPDRRGFRSGARARMSTAELALRQFAAASIWRQRRDRVGILASPAWLESARILALPRQCEADDDSTTTTAQMAMMRRRLLLAAVAAASAPGA